MVPLPLVMAPNRFSSTSVRPEPSRPAMPRISPLRSWKLASFRRVYLPERCSTSRITSPGLLVLGREAVGQLPAHHQLDDLLHGQVLGAAGWPPTDRPA